jgi:hypothetical protein
MVDLKRLIASDNASYYDKFNGIVTGAMICKGNPTVRIARNADSRLGYRVTLSVNINMKDAKLFLLYLQMALQQKFIESTISSKGLSVGKLESIVNLEKYLSPHKAFLGEKWKMFWKVTCLVSERKHLTQAGLEEIIEIVGA